MEAREVVGRRLDRIAATARRIAGRRPWVRRLLVIGAGLVAVWAYAGLTAGVRSAAADWGEAADVWVAGDDHEPGDRLVTEQVSFPRHLIPPDALTAAPDGEVVAQRIAAGEVIVGPDLAGPPGPAALAPAGWIVVAIRDPLVDHAAPGAPVQISSDGIVLAVEGVVTGTVDGIVSVAVPADEAPFVAAAAQAQAASLLFPAPRVPGE